MRSAYPVLATRRSKQSQGRRAVTVPVSRTTTIISYPPSALTVSAWTCVSSTTACWTGPGSRHRNRTAPMSVAIIWLGSTPLPGRAGHPVPPAQE